MKTIKRTAEANWKGELEGGHGLITTESKALTEQKYGFMGRFESENSAPETNPEELIAAAAASCFSMALSKTLGDEGHKPTKLLTRATLEMDMTDSGPKHGRLHLAVEGVVDGLDESGFKAAVEATRQSCPVYQMFKEGLSEITVEATMN